MSGPVVRQGAAAGAARVRLFLTDVEPLLRTLLAIRSAAGEEATDEK